MTTTTDGLSWAHADTARLAPKIATAATKGQRLAIASPLPAQGNRPATGNAGNGAQRVNAGGKMGANLNGADSTARRRSKTLATHRDDLRRGAAPRSGIARLLPRPGVWRRRCAAAGRHRAA